MPTFTCSSFSFFRPFCSPDPKSQVACSSAGSCRRSFTHSSPSRLDAKRRFNQHKMSGSTAFRTGCFPAKISSRTPWRARGRLTSSNTAKVSFAFRPAANVTRPNFATLGVSSQQHFQQAPRHGQTDSIGLRDASKLGLPVRIDRHPQRLKLVAPPHLGSYKLIIVSHWCASLSSAAV